MIAEIFYIEGVQGDLANKIKENLKQHIDSDIQINEYKFPQDYNYSSPEHVHRNMTTYLRLLKLSMLKINDFYVKLENGANWCYLGYEACSYSSTSFAGLDISSQNFQSLFPAVALMNRMVLLPEGSEKIYDSLRKDNYKYLFKPLASGGISLIDFTQENHLKNTLIGIKSILDYDLEKYCIRYIELKKEQEPAYDVLSELLGVKEKYLENIRKNMTGSQFKIVPTITGDQKVYINRTSRIQIDFYKETPLIVKDVYVKIQAPAGVIPEGKYQADLHFNLNGTETQSLELEVIPKTYPCCPLEIQFSFNEVQFGQNPMPFPIPLFLEVSEG